MLTVFCIGLFRYALGLSLPVAPLANRILRCRDTFSNLAFGPQGIALTLKNVFLCFMQKMPSSGPSSACCPGWGRSRPSRCSCRSPSRSPEGSIIMLAGIFYGAQYGGSTTAILRQHAR